MKKHMISMAEKIWAFRGLLTVFCVAAVLFGVSFVSHADTVKGTITGSNVNVRETASTSATAVATVTTDELVDVIAETTGTDDMKWYKITTSAGVTGYVRSDFIKKATVTVDVTQTDSKTAYIAGSNANIRQDANTSSGRVANALGGSKVTIIGEATGADGYKWYQIEFQGNGTTMKGFIRSDLVTFEAPVQEPEITEIEGEMSEEGSSEVASEPASSEETPSEEVPSEEPPVEETPSEAGKISIPLSGNEGTFIILEPDSVVEILPQGFEQTELQLGEEIFTVWGKGQFYVMYASVNDGAPQYYLYDAINKSFVAYTGLLTANDVAANKGGDGLNYKVIAIVCIALIVVLAIVVAVLVYKLSNSDYKDADDHDDDDDDDYDDYDDDMDEDDFLDLSETANLSEVNEAVAEYVPEEENVYETYETDTNSAESTLDESMLEYMATTSDVTYETQVLENVYEVPQGQADVYETAENNMLFETEESSYEASVESLEAFEEEAEERPKKAKKEKKKFTQRILDYFTVEVDDDEDDDDDDYDDDEDEDDKPAKKSSVKRFDDDDDDDLNFIDL